MPALKDSLASAMIDAFTAMVTANSKIACQRHAARLLVPLWRIIPREARREFLNHVQPDGDHEWIGWFKRVPKRDDPELEQALREIGAHLDEMAGEERKFVESLLRQTRFGEQNISDKQRGWVVRLWRKHRTVKREAA